MFFSNFAGKMAILRTARIGYVIHSVNIFIHSIVSSVDTPLVANTVNPPVQI